MSNRGVQRAGLIKMDEDVYKTRVINVGISILMVVTGSLNTIAAK